MILRYHAEDSRLAGIQVRSGHPLLVPAAQEAVKKWVYQATLLSGNPVEVVTAADASFNLH